MDGWFRRTRRSKLSVIFAVDGAHAAVRESKVQLGDAGDVEAFTGDVASALKAATGKWILVVPEGAAAAESSVRLLVDAAPSGCDVVVFTSHTPSGDDEVRRQALVSPHVLVRRRIAAGFAPPTSFGGDWAFRAHALSRAVKVHAVRGEQTDEVAGSRSPRLGGLPPAEAAREWLALFEYVDALSATDRLRGSIQAVKNLLATEIGRIAALEEPLRFEIFGEADRRHLRGFSRRLVNVECARELAIVYGFPPFLDTGGFVVARRFDERNVAYDVVTQDMRNRRVLDKRSLELAQRNLGRRMLVRAPLATGNWAQVEKFCREGMARIEEREAEAGPYSSLYSRSMWIAPSVLAAWYKARNPSTPWVAELSDPLAYRPNGDLRPNPFPENPILDEIRAAVERVGQPGWHGDRFFEAVEWMIYALADRICFTNEHQRDFMLGAFPDRELASRARAKSTIMSHPVPPEPLYAMSAPKLELDATKISIGYFGNFYGVRGVDDLLAPFGELTAQERSRVQLLIFTPTADEIGPLVQEHPARDCVTVLPALPYFEFLALTRRMDWLLVADAHSPAVFGTSPFLPSKLADYRGSGTPVWGIVESGSILGKQQLDERSLLGDSADGAAAVRRILARS